MLTFKIILRFLRLTADLSNEPKRYHTSLFIYDKNLSPASMQEILHHQPYNIYIRTRTSTCMISMRRCVPENIKKFSEKKIYSRYTHIYVKQYTLSSIPSLCSISCPTYEQQQYMIARYKLQTLLPLSV